MPQDHEYIIFLQYKSGPFEKQILIFNLIFCDESEVAEEEDAKTEA
jgi:hypothetical protein